MKKAVLFFSLVSLFSVGLASCTSDPDVKEDIKQIKEDLAKTKEDLSRLKEDHAKLIKDEVEVEKVAEDKMEGAELN